MQHSDTGVAFTGLTLAIFRANGALIAAGDKLVKDLGLNSARWQVLGMIVENPLTVSAIARRVGLARQSVQRTADRLVETGFAQFIPNPDHATANLLDLTSHGRQVMDEVECRQVEWANRVSQGYEADRIDQVVQSIQSLCDRLATDGKGGDL